MNAVDIITKTKRKERLTKKEIDWLNAYHAEVYEKIAPYLSSEERNWLQEATALLKD